MRYGINPLQLHPYINAPQQHFARNSCCVKGVPTRKEIAAPRKEHGSNSGRIYQHVKNIVVTEGYGSSKWKASRKVFVSVAE